MIGQKTRQVLKTWGATTRNVLGLAVAAGFTAMCLAPASANAAGCHIFWSHTAFQGDFEAVTDTYTVPSWSTCHDINLSNITQTGNHNNHCMNVHVQFFPSSGGIVDGPNKYLCSTSPGGPWVVLASNVLDGTRYRVVYAMPRVGDRFSFQIMD